MWLAYFQSYLENDFPKLLKENMWNYKHGLCLDGLYMAMPFYARKRTVR